MFSEKIFWESAALEWRGYCEGDSDTRWAGEGRADSLVNDGEISTADCFDCISSGPRCGLIASVVSSQALLHRPRSLNSTTAFIYRYFHHIFLPGAQYAIFLGGRCTFSLEHQSHMLIWLVMLHKVVVGGHVGYLSCWWKWLPCYGGVRGSCFPWELTDWWWSFDRWRSLNSRQNPAFSALSMQSVTKVLRLGSLT